MTPAVATPVAALPAEHILPARAAELGGIRIGTRDPDSRFPAVKLNHFIVTTPERDARGVLVPDEAVMEALADGGHADADGKIRRIPVMFGSNAIGDVLQIRWEWWLGKTVLGGCSSPLVVGNEQVTKKDVTVTFFADPQTGTPYPDGPRVLPWADEMQGWTLPEDAGKAADQQRPLLKLSTTLSVMIASEAASFGGLYVFRSRSWWTANQLLGCLQRIKSLTGGLLRGPVFRLCVRPKVTRSRHSTVYVVHVECQGADLKALAALRQAARDYVAFEKENLLLVSEIAAASRAIAGRTPDADPGEDEPAPQPAAEPRALPPAALLPAAERSPPDSERSAQAEQLYAAALDAAAGLPGLATRWAAVTAAHKLGGLDAAAYARLASRKDARKTALQAPTTPPATAEPAANPVAALADRVREAMTADDLAAIEADVLPALQAGRIDRPSADWLAELLGERRAELAAAPAPY